MTKRDGLVVVVRGDGWALAWPRDKWEALDDEEQRQVIARQVALMPQNVPKNRTRYRDRSIPARRGIDTAAVAAHKRPQVLHGE